MWPHWAGALPAAVCRSAAEMQTRIDARHVDVVIFREITHNGGVLETVERWQLSVSGHFGLRIEGGLYTYLVFRGVAQRQSRCQRDCKSLYMMEEKKSGQQAGGVVLKARNLVAVTLQGRCKAWSRQDRCYRATLRISQRGTDGRVYSTVYLKRQLPKCEKAVKGRVVCG